MIEQEHREDHEQYKQAAAWAENLVPGQKLDNLPEGVSTYMNYANQWHRQVIVSGYAFSAFRVTLAPDNTILSINRNP